MQERALILEPNPAVSVAEDEYRRLLGFPRGAEPGDRAQELSAQSRAWYQAHGRPWFYAGPPGAVTLAGGTVRMGDAVFKSGELHARFAEAEVRQAVVVAVSAGEDCEVEARRRWEQEKPDEYFFLEIFGSAVAEQLVTAAGAGLCAWAEQGGLAVLPHYSPGYTGWDVADQVQLYELLGSVPGRLPGSLSVNASGMLRPKKSLLALFGLTSRIDLVGQRSQLVPCTGCGYDRCQFRRAPYLGSRPLLEDVRTLQPNRYNSDPSPLGSPRYTVNRRALEKWSAERVEILPEAGGTVRARFRFDGTTCSNMGRPLAYLYEVLRTFLRS